MTRPGAGAPPRTDLAAWKTQLATARSGAALLDALLSPHDAAALVPKLPPEDLHLYLRTIGLADSTELLALASGEQVRAILDHEVWVGDRPDVDRLDPWMGALMQAGPTVLYRRLLELDDELLNWVVRRSVDVIVVEDPDGFDPPDVEHVMTPDNRLCICFPESAPRDMPVKLFLDMLIREDTAYCINLLVFAGAAVDSVLEEQAYRWRSGRMADRGYVDYYEALAIYTAPPRSARPGPDADIGEAPAHRFVAPVIDPEARLAAAFAALPPADADRARAGLGYVANMALSADRVEPWDLEAQQSVLARIRAGLVLGLDALTGPQADAAADATVLATTSMGLVFRTGYARTLEAAAPARRAAADGLLAGPEGRLDAVDLPRLKPWVEALCGRHPTLPDEAPIASPDDLARVTAAASIVAELARCAEGRPDAVGIGAWLFTAFAHDALGEPAGGPLALAKVPAVALSLFTEGQLRPEARAAAEAWWARIGGHRPEALAALLEEARGQVGAVRDGAPDIRYTPILWVGDAAG